VRGLGGIEQAWAMKSMQYEERVREEVFWFQNVDETEFYSPLTASPAICAAAAIYCL
jgi:hypothetical protein